MHNKELKQRAVTLRKKGYSYSEVSIELGIPEGTCSSWLSSVPLSIRARKILHQKGLAGSKKGRQAAVERRRARYRTIEKVVAEDVSQLMMNKSIKRLLCSFLYWGEGAKSGQQLRIINSDPILVSTYLELLRSSFMLDESKFGATLHLHSYHNQDKQLQFWAKLTKIPINRIGIYRKKNSGTIKRPGYPGCISINYYDVRLFKAITAYYKNGATLLGA